MKSIALFTEEMDDLETGVVALRGQLDDTQLCKNSVGLLFAHSDTDFDELTSLLTGVFDFPVIGCTATSLFSVREGFMTEGISMQIFTADDCEFSVGVTDELSDDNVGERVADTYKEVAENLSEKEKLIIAYGTKPRDIIPDTVLQALDKVSGGTPVFGGICSDNFDFENCRVFCNGVVKEHGLAMIMISGNVRPLLKYAFSVSTVANFAETVTEIDGRYVKKLGNKTFLEAVKSAGLNFQRGDDPFVDFVSTPFLISYVTPEGEEIQVLRHIEDVDFSNGSASFVGDVPVGAVMKIAMFSRKDVAMSVANVIGEAIEEVMSINDYKYNSAIITSCASRLLNYSNDIVNETYGYMPVIPKGISFTGLYSFGEFCPVKSEKAGNGYNVFHNAAFALLVM